MANLSNPGYTVILEDEDGLQRDLWTTFGLALCSREIESPEVQVHEVEIPGREGLLDLTEALDGYVHYYNREITMEFKMVSRDELFSYYSKLANWIHGQKMKIFFDDEMEEYFYGRCTIDKMELSNDAPWGAYLTIIADCEPFRYYVDAGTYSGELVDLESITVSLDKIWERSTGDGCTTSWYANDDAENPCECFTEIQIEWINEDWETVTTKPSLTLGTTDDFLKSWNKTNSNKAASGYFNIAESSGSDYAFVTAGFYADGYASSGSSSGALDDDIIFTEINYISLSSNGTGDLGISAYTAEATTEPCIQIELEGVMNHPTPSIYSPVSGLMISFLDGRYWELEAGWQVLDDLTIGTEDSVLYVFQGTATDDDIEDLDDEDNSVIVKYSGGTL